MNGFSSNRDYSVVNAALSDPWFAGTGFTAGSVLPGLVGYEWGTIVPGCAPVQTVFFNYPGSPTESLPGAQSTRYVAPSGAVVFSTGTMNWSRTLDPWSQRPDGRVEAFTRNVLAALTAAPVVNVPPQAGFSWSPVSPTTVDTVVFTDTSSDSDGVVLARAWDLDGSGGFDDGTGVTASRVFSVPGVYVVRLRVTDDKGATSVAATTVAVVAAPVVNVPPRGGGGGGGGLPDLGVTLTANTATARPGDEVDFVATVTNKGGQSSVQTHIRIDLPPTMTLLGPPAYERGSGCSGTQTIDCFLDFLPGGASARIVFAVRLSGSGPEQLTASVSSNLDSYPADNTATVTVQVIASFLPPAPVVTPAFGAIVGHPSEPVAGKQFTLAVAVRRSDSGGPLLRGTASCELRVGGTSIAHRTTFRGGMMRITARIPRGTSRRLLTVKLSVMAGGRVAIHRMAFRIRSR